jgi:hypothetical protein
MTENWKTDNYARIVIKNIILNMEKVVLDEEIKKQKNI